MAEEADAEAGAEFMGDDKFSMPGRLALVQPDGRVLCRTSDLTGSSRSIIGGRLPGFFFRCSRINMN